DFVGNAGSGQLVLGGADGADLGAGIDTRRNVLGQQLRARIAQDVQPGCSSLHVGRSGQRGKADHVADGVDVRQLCLIRVINVDLPTAIDFDANLVQTQIIGIARAAVGPEQDVGLELLAALERKDHAVV